MDGFASHDFTCFLYMKAYIFFMAMSSEKACKKTRIHLNACFNIQHKTDPWCPPYIRAVGFLQVMNLTISVFFFCSPDNRIDNELIYKSSLSESFSPHYSLSVSFLMVQFHSFFQVFQRFFPCLSL